MEKKKAALRDFQENLSLRIASAAETSQQALLGLEVAGAKWLVDLAEAGEIMPVPTLYPVPLSVSWFKGLANVRGTLFGVTDFAQFQGYAPIHTGGDARLLLVVVRRGSHCAIMVSRLTGMRNRSEFVASELSSTDRTSPWESEVLQDDQGQKWSVLNVEGLLSAPAFLNAGVEYAVQRGVRNTY